MCRLLRCKTQALPIVDRYRVEQDKYAVVKNKKRVSEYGEVFTAEREVKSMCDLIPADVWKNIDSTFLEPSCGNGNFLVEIFSRKLTRCRTTDEALRALKGIYAVDLLPDNIAESRNRLYGMFSSVYGESDTAAKILSTNIVCGNTLTGKRADGTPIEFLVKD